MIELRSRAEVEAMRPAGRFVAEVLAELALAARPGVRLVDLDRLAQDRIRARDPGRRPRREHDLRRARRGSHDARAP